MTRIECKYLAKLDLLESILTMIDNEDLTVDEFRSKILRSIMFYRRALANLE